MLFIRADQLSDYSYYCEYVEYTFILYQFAFVSFRVLFCLSRSMHDL
ncbi:hypothetical protein BCPG1_193 [Bacillus phage BCPG1]|nr:hypothetical protein BCPG1_193 [Bacillus phage BCPG1]